MNISRALRLANSTVWRRVFKAYNADYATQIWQVELMLKIGGDLLGDLHGYKAFRQDATELLDELRSWQQDAFAEWSRDILSQIDDPNAPLRSVDYL